MSIDGGYCKPEFKLRTTIRCVSHGSSGTKLLAEKTLNSFFAANAEARSMAFADFTSNALPVTLQLETMTSGRPFRISKTNRFMMSDASAVAIAFVGLEVAVSE